MPLDTMWILSAITPNSFDRVVTTEDSANNCLDYHREKLDFSNVVIFVYFILYFE